MKRSIDNNLIRKDKDNDIKKPRQIVILKKEEMVITEIINNIEKMDICK